MTARLLPGLSPARLSFGSESLNARNDLQDWLDFRPVGLARFSFPCTASNLQTKAAFRDPNRRTTLFAVWTHTAPFLSPASIFNTFQQLAAGSSHENENSYVQVLEQKQALNFSSQVEHQHAACHILEDKAGPGLHKDSTWRASPPWPPKSKGQAKQRKDSVTVHARGSLRILRLPLTCSSCTFRILNQDILTETPANCRQSPSIRCCRSRCRCTAVEGYSARRS